MKIVITKIPRRKQFYHPSVYNSYNEILNSLRKYTAIFDLATVFMFLEWCSVYQPPIAISNIHPEGENCCILKEEYWGNVHYTYIMVKIKQLTQMRCIFL